MIFSVVATSDQRRIGCSAPLFRAARLRQEENLFIVMVAVQLPAQPPSRMMMIMMMTALTKTMMMEKGVVGGAWRLGSPSLSAAFA